MNRLSTFDLKIRATRRPASIVMSRGQMKICALALQLAHQFCEHRNTQCVVLIDDIVAELDEKICALLWKGLWILNPSSLLPAQTISWELFKNKFGNSLVVSRGTWNNERREQKHMSEETNNNMTLQYQSTKRT